MGDILFVNKSGSSTRLSRSSPTTAAAVLSHAQRARRKAEGSSQTKPWSGFTSVFDPSHGAEISRGSEQTGADTLIIIEQSGQTWRPNQLPRKFPVSNGYDPFHCTIVGTDAETHALLLRTFFDVARSNFIAEAFAPNPQQQSERTKDATSRHTSIITRRLQRCVGDKLLMYATLAYSSSILGWTTGRFRHKKPPEFFIAKALPTLRSSLGQNHCAVTDWLLLSLYSLAITEFWNGLPVVWKRHPERCDMISRTALESLEAARTHLRALVNLVTNTGGWQLFDPYIFDSTVLLDKYLAIATTKPPLLSLVWDPGPLPKNLRSEVDITESAYPQLGRRLLKEPLAADLVKILKDLVAHCRIARDIWLPAATVTPELETWLFRRFQALQYRLLFQFHHETIHYHNRCTCLAAFIFACVTTPSHGPQLGATYLAQTLREELEEQSSLSEDFASRDLSLWYHFVGSLARGPSIEDHQSWYSRQLELHLQERDDNVQLSSLMEEYLFLPFR